MNHYAAEVPLNMPLYGASFGQAVSRYFKKYATFSGRASRSEYWWVQLFLFLVYLIPAILVGIGTSSAMGVDGSVTYDELWTTPTGAIGLTLSAIMWLAFIIPNLALLWRRLHDANLGGPWALLYFVPGVGSLIILIMTLLPSNPAGARFDRA